MMLLNQNTAYNPLRYSTESYEPDEEEKQNNVIINNPYQPKNYHIAHNMKNYNVSNYHMTNVLNRQRILNMPTFHNFNNFKSPTTPNIMNSPSINLINKTNYNNIQNYTLNRNPYQFSNGKTINYSQIAYPHRQIVQPVINNKNNSFMTPIKQTKIISKTPINNTKMMYSFNMGKQLNVTTPSKPNINMSRNIIPYTMRQIPTNVIRQNTISLNKNVNPIHRIVYRRKV